MFTTRMLQLTLAVSLILPMAAQAAEDAPAKDTKPVKIDQSTPQKAAEGFTSNMSKKRYSLAFRYLTDDSQDLLVQGFGRILPFVLKFAKTEQQKQDIQAIIKKHNIAWDEAQNAPQQGALKKLKDKGAFFGDMLNYFEKQRKKKGKKGGTPFSRMAQMKFVNFKIEGDSATADVVLGGKQQEQPAYFKRIKEKWHVDLAEAQKRAKKRLKKKLKKKKLNKK